MLALVLSLGDVAVAQDGFVWDDADLIEQTGFRNSLTGDIAAFSDDSCDPCLGSTTESDQWHLLPDGLLWQSYLAAPQEPRISTVIFGDDNEGIFWDATLGGRVGLLRYGTGEAHGASGWQWDLEGAVITRLDLLHAEDVESMDYRFGTEMTWADGPWAMKIGYFHISSHVGDEYLIRNPTFTRINYVTESWIVGGSYRPRDDMRLYGEFANAFRASGGAKRYQFQTGAEYTPIAKNMRRGAPFAAVNLNFREAVDYDVSTTVQAGWSFQSLKSGRRIRFGAQYGDGPTSQFSFFQRRESYLGMGVWFDY
ncbi:DUF1207 domain-containing protein [Neorhodopirellula pilleata]|nr:DUF1207 domain-containing protein [Neorhodopirellula pilleata]